MRTYTLLAFPGPFILGLALAAGCTGAGNDNAGGAGGAGASSTSSSSQSSSATSSSSTSSSASSSSGMGGGPNTSDITGTAISTWLGENSELPGIAEGALTVAATFQNPDKTWGEIAGTYDSSKGTFVIKGVPDGPYYLHVGKASYYAETARTGLDLGYVRGGRPDAQSITISPTNLSLNLTNLAPWQDPPPMQSGDTMELFSLGANSWGDLATIAPVVPTAGATMISAFTPDLSALFIPGLIDGNKGDKAIITDITTRVAGNLTYQALGKALTLPSLTLKDGQPSMSGGAFTDVAQTQITVDWKRSAFEALLPSAGPGVTARSYDVSAWIEPGGDNRVSTAGAPSLFYLSDAGATDVSLTLDYGNPFPPTWSAIGIVEVYYGLTQNVQSPTKGIPGFLWVSGPINALLQGPVVPKVTPPTGVTIGGMAATSDLMGVGVNPVIAWTAPAMGTPTEYRVRIYSFDAMGRHTLADLFTTDTTVTVPPGILKLGTPHAAAIQASTGLADIKAPYRSTPLSDAATALTKLFTP